MSLLGMEIECGKKIIKKKIVNAEQTCRFGQPNDPLTFSFYNFKSHSLSYARFDKKNQDEG